MPVSISEQLEQLPPLKKSKSIKCGNLEMDLSGLKEVEKTRATGSVSKDSGNNRGKELAKKIAIRIIEKQHILYKSEITTAKQFT